jgi:hypothetical protein
MAALLFKNNATTTLSGSINDTQTTITVANSSVFPVITGDDYFYATMYEVAGGVEINIEIVKVTATTGLVWTIARGQDGTAARARTGIVDVYIELRWIAASAGLMLQKDRNLADLANVATARTNLGLGSMATQSASAVNITGGTISGVTLTSLDSQTTINDNADPTKGVQFEVSGISTGTTRTLTIPNASGTIALVSDLASGYQPLDADLTALAGLSASGIIARTGSGTVAVRNLIAPAAGITISNGDGVSGNPTLALANDLAAVEGISTTGFVRRTAADTWTASAIADGDLPSALTGKTYNGLTLTANTTGFSVAGGTTSKTLTVSNNLTLAGTDGSTLNIGSGGTLGTGAFATIANYAPLASPTFTGTVTTPNLAFNTAGGVISGDFSNATASSRVAFQSSTTNGSTIVTAKPNGTATASYFIAHNAAAVDNSAYAYLGVTNTAVLLDSNKIGTGTVVPLIVRTNGADRLTFGVSGGADLATGLREAKVTMAANDIDLRAGNYFTKTFSAGSVSITASNVPASGTVGAFILEATNAGLATITWPTGTKWAGGTAPTLTSSGVDIIGFYTHDGGTTWRAMLLSKDSK